MTKDLALITGAAGLLGVEHAIALQSEGFHVLMTDLSKASVEARVLDSDELDSERLDIAELDITDEIAVESFASELASYGNIKVLVNNAQGAHVDDDLDFEHSTLEAWNAVVNVGLTGTYLCCKHFGPQISEGGSVINLSSIYGLVSPDFRVYEDVDFSSSAAYSAAKAGVVGLTKYLAVYWAKRNIRVNSVTPGGVFNNQPSEFTDAYSGRVPMGRMGTVNELRGVIGWLASEGSSYVTGQNIVVDGGLSAW
jgi:NAD(P)-dependent dehydrogenase (short-subunit alcohol dehydrogenase family)